MVVEEEETINKERKEKEQDYDFNGSSKVFLRWILSYRGKEFWLAMEYKEIEYLCRIEGV